MTIEKQILSKHVGAVFHRCALQVNPHEYLQTFRGQKGATDADDYVRSMIEKAAELGISVLAVTDHNDVSSVPVFRAAAQDRGVHIFPGFELSSREGVHVLCIYPPDTSRDQLGRYLGSFGITKTEPSADLANKSFVDILREVREQGGVAIAAHVTSENGGLLRVLNGQARVQAWRCEYLLAVQIPGAVEDLPPNLRKIVENKNPEYRREQAADRHLAVAVVNAMDVATPEDLENPAATCWIKMSQVSIEGLRQAFLDPGSRIRLNSRADSLKLEEHVELVELAWQGGFLDGCTILLNPNLNVLVGGRGTGKSTVIESLRAVLGLDPLGDEARKAHQGIVRQVLRSGTRISLRVRAYRPVAHEYTVERTLPNPPVVRDAQGAVSDLSPLDVVPRLEIFGQHEISELARSPERLTRLLDRFVQRDDALVRRKLELRRELEKNRRSLLDVREEIQRIDEQLAALPALEETLKRFEDAGLEEKLKEQSLIVREERVIASLAERMAPFRECLDNLKGEVPIDRAFVSAKALKDLPGKEILSRLNAVLERFDGEVATAASFLEAAINRADEGINSVRRDWESHKARVQLAYETILRELQKSRVDGEEFIRLRRMIEELRPLQERRKKAQTIERELAERRRNLLVEWENAKAGEFRALDQAAETVSKKLRDRVQVKVTAAGDREPLFRILKEDIGGRLSEAIESLRQATDLSLPQLVDACIAGAEDVARRLGIPPAQAARLAQADAGILMRIEELDLPPTTTILLNTAPHGGPPTWTTLEDLSTGQKATAVLLLLLLDSNGPLVVDQPEDDLDNRFITEGIVPRIREEKQRRQFVFSTHNANIPVLGDAELIIGLAASGEPDGGHARIAPEHVGSIDDQPVRELIEEILEGGREAFERRRRKYGF